MWLPVYKSLIFNCNVLTCTLCMTSAHSKISDESTMQKIYSSQQETEVFFFCFVFVLVHFYCTVNENMQKKTPAMNNRNNKTLYGQIKLVVCVYKFIQYMQVCSHFHHLCVKRSVYDQTQ